MRVEQPDLRGIVHPEPPPKPTKRKAKPLRGWRLVPASWRGQPCDVCAVAGYLLNAGPPTLVDRLVLAYYTGGDAEPLGVCLGHAVDLGSEHRLAQAERKARR